DEEKQRFKKIDSAIAPLKGKRRTFLTGLVMTDENASPPSTQLLYQGDLTQPRQEVAPGVLSALEPGPLAIKSPPRPNSSGRRSALADWIVSDRNPLTARVLVNRIWQGHFGEGLQSTPNDFGLAGARPTNAPLLDWLAR